MPYQIGSMSRQSGLANSRSPVAEPEGAEIHPAVRPARPRRRVEVVARPQERAGQGVRAQRPLHQRPVVQARFVQGPHPHPHGLVVGVAGAVRHPLAVGVEGDMAGAAGLHAGEKRLEGAHLAQTRVVRRRNHLIDLAAEGGLHVPRRVRAVVGDDGDDAATVEQTDPPADFLHVAAPVRPGPGIEVIQQVAHDRFAPERVGRLVVRADGAAGQARRDRPGGAFTVPGAGENRRRRPTGALPAIDAPRRGPPVPAAELAALGRRSPGRAGQVVS